jgi:hypothetical protein
MVPRYHSLIGSNPSSAGFVKHGTEIVSPASATIILSDINTNHLAGSNFFGGASNEGISLFSIV